LLRQAAGRVRRAASFWHSGPSATASAALPGVLAGHGVPRRIGQQYQNKDVGDSDAADVSTHHEPKHQEQHPVHDRPTLHKLPGGNVDREQFGEGRVHIAGFSLRLGAESTQRRINDGVRCQT